MENEEEIKKTYEDIVKEGYKAIKKIRLIDYTSIKQEEINEYLSHFEIPFNVLNTVQSIITSGTFPENDLEKMMLKFINHAVLHLNNFIGNLKLILEEKRYDIEYKGKTPSYIINSLSKTSSK